MLIEIVAYEDMLVIQKVWKRILEIFFPIICISCSKYLPQEDSENLLCEECFNAIDILQEIPEAQIHAVGLYSSKPLRDLIHGLKFKRYIRAMNQIGELIDKYLKKNPHSILKTCDLITFIPLHPKREKNRGFNQSELIAKELGDKLGIEVIPTLKRIRDTKEQSSLGNYASRAKNVDGCFSMINTYPQNKSIILVDDVYTSGSTILEATVNLKQSLPRKVVIFVLSRA